ncbi:MAG: hypothetical protein LBH01_02145 [Verrucomicrobiales bacterium]|jgi:hypothetical protein|nr:hypothetical protein [Verrucomicrobiales bacterium]
MKKNTNNTAGATVMPMAEIFKLNQSQACALFAERSGVSQRAFAEMGKLHFSISAKLKPKESIYKILRANGVKDSAISNASYASKVWAMVEDKYLTEKQFDSLSFADCYTMIRAMSEDSACQLIESDISGILKESKDPHLDFESIFKTGMPAAEAEAYAKKQEKLRKEEEKAREARIAEAEKRIAANAGQDSESGEPEEEENTDGKVIPINRGQSPVAATVKTASRAGSEMKKATAEDALELISTLEVMLIEIEDKEELKSVAQRLSEITKTAAELAADNGKAKKPSKKTVAMAA